MKIPKVPIKNLTVAAMFDAYWSHVSVPLACSR